MDIAYPRPQLRRAAWTSLNGPWRFCFDDACAFQAPQDVTDWPRDIVVPFPPESKASGIDDRGFHSVCWYQRDVELEPDDGRVLLRFGAVDYRAQVWVNGNLAVTHEGGHTPFSADITHLLDPSGLQVITVRAHDDPSDLTKPRGKQDWQLEPHSIWYPRTSGIWQTVWLERVGRTYIDKLRWTPKVEGYAIYFEARIAGDRAPDLEIDIQLRHGEKLLAHDRYRVVDGEVDRIIVLSDPGIDDFRNELLWSPERPTLLDAHVRLISGGQVVDSVDSYTALRSVHISRDRFMLNGRPYLLRMVLDQGYWPDTLLAAPDDEALRRDVELAKAMGFNGVRKHQKIEDPRYLYWADKLGLMVWEEMPSAYRFTKTAVSRLLREWMEVIERDFSHPCIVMWVPFNESWGVPELPAIGTHRHAVQALYHLTKTLDANRPVIGNDGWESSATDVIGIHDYDPDLQHLRQRYGGDAAPPDLLDRRRPGGRILTLDGYPHEGQPVMLTEFGGIAFDTTGRVAAHMPQLGDEAPAKSWGYDVVDSAEEFARRYEQLLDTVIDLDFFSGFCYTQFADTFQEANGLLNADRSPKFDIARVKAATSRWRAWIAAGI